MALMQAILIASLIGSSLVSAGTPPPAGGGAARAWRPLTDAGARLAVTDSFSPPPRNKGKSKKRRPSKTAPDGAGDDKDSDSDSVPELPPPRRRPPASAVPRRRIEPSDTETPEGQLREGRLKVEVKANGRSDDVVSRRPGLVQGGVGSTAVDEQASKSDEALLDEGLPGLAAVVPRLVWLAAGASALGRTFAYNTTLQKESTFPRPGVTLSLEAYPLVRMPGWFRTIGVGVSYALELGSAALLQMDGSANSYPVKQQRWMVDVRYAISLGERVVVIPAFGYATSRFDVERTTPPPPPSQCTSALTQVCIANVDAGGLSLDAHVRIAVTSELRLTASIGYLLGLRLAKNAGQIASEADSASWSGVRGEVAASYAMNEWFALRLAVPFLLQRYSFGGVDLPYSAASETYYGVVLGAAVFTR